jgi:hypothetical protein
MVSEWLLGYSVRDASGSKRIEALRWLTRLLEKIH